MIAKGISLAMALALSIPGFAQDDPTSKVRFDQKLGAQVPLKLTFYDEIGKPVPLGRYFTDRPVILVLAYYACPQLCTLVFNGLVDTIKKTPLKLGADFDVVTVSIDPKEGPMLASRKKTAYMTELGAKGDPNAWHFLTGDADSIQKLTEAVGFRYAYDVSSKQYVHASGIMVATADGVLSRYFFGVQYPERDLRLAVVDASKNKVGSITDKLLLLCYHFDPATGKYSLLITRILNAFEALLLVGLGVGIYSLARRSREKGAGA